MRCPRCKENYVFNTAPGAVTWFPMNCYIDKDCPINMDAKMPTDRDPLLQEREKTHGSFFRKRQYLRKDIKDILRLYAHYQQYQS